MTTSTQTFFADAVLFDMDGTLTDSISAVEAAWGKVARDIGQDPEYVIAATHGKRAIDNLAQFKPELKAHEMDAEVESFENTILYYADAYHMHSGGTGTPASGGRSRAGSFVHHPGATVSNLSSGAETPELTPTSTAPSSRRPSVVADAVRRPSFTSRLLNLLSVAARLRVQEEHQDTFVRDGEDMIHTISEEDAEHAKADALEAWKLEAASVDRSVQILPGVKKMIASIPDGRYAVATSGAKTYAYGCMNRVGIVPPPVTITADDKRLKAGKPAPDPFLLAADCLGYDAKNCVVFEDSPSGIRAGVASGATVIAVCTSHERSQIENCGAHYIVNNMDSISCRFDEEKQRLQFSVRQ